MPKAKANGLQVDRRVRIALSVLPPTQKSVVERIVSSRRAFARASSASGRVQRMRTSGEPLYMMRVSPTLRLIYTMVGDTVYVVDLVERATLDHFAARRAAKSQDKKQAPKAAARKTPTVVEK